MVYEIHWLRRASNELEAIFQFYNHLAGEKVAKNWVGLIIHAVKQLEVMPYLGRVDEEFVHIRQYRYLVVLRYKVYYFLENGKVFIASVWDCRQGNRTFDD